MKSSANTLNGFNNYGSTSTNSKSKNGSLFLNKNSINKNQRSTSAMKNTQNFGFFSTLSNFKKQITASHGDNNLTDPAQDFQVLTSRAPTQTSQNLQFSPVRF